MLGVEFERAARTRLPRRMWHCRQTAFPDTRQVSLVVGRCTSWQAEHWTPFKYIGSYIVVALHAVFVSRSFGPMRELAVPGDALRAGHTSASRPPAGTDRPVVVAALNGIGPAVPESGTDHTRRPEPRRGWRG